MARAYVQEEVLLTLCVGKDFANYNEGKQINHKLQYKHVLRKLIIDAIKSKKYDNYEDFGIFQIYMDKSEKNSTYKDLFKKAEKKILEAKKVSKNNESFIKSKLRGWYSKQELRDTLRRKRDMDFAWKLAKERGDDDLKYIFAVFSDHQLYPYLKTKKKISYISIRKALQSLEKKGLIKSKTGTNFGYYWLNMDDKDIGIKLLAFLSNRLDDFMNSNFFKTFFSKDILNQMEVSRNRK